MTMDRDPGDGVFPLKGKMRVDLNEASREELEAIASPEIVQIIIDNRPFGSIADLLKCGMDEAAVDSIEASGGVIGGS
jgi:DNA uptake protein ComE-like DNA-binding protein